MKIEGYEQKRSEVELDLDRMAQQVQNLFNNKKYNDQMDFNASQHLAIKVIMELIDSSGGSDFVRHEGKRFEDNIMLSV